MWSKFEKQFIGIIYDELEEETLEDILPLNLIDVIKEEGGVAYENLRYSFTPYISQK